MERSNIVVIGSMNYDIILKMSRQPEEGETLPANDAKFSAGGKGANQAVQCAKLGVRTYMVGCLGTDSMGDTLRKTAEGYGLDCSHVRTVDGPSGLGVVQAMDNGNVFASIVRGANFALTRQDVDDAEPLLREAALLILQNEIPPEINEYAIDKARACGCPVLLNAAPAVPFPREYLKKCDVLVLNEVEAGFYAETTIDTVEKAKVEAEKMARELGNCCVFTLGGNGAVVSDGVTTKEIPSLHAPAVETTGAGDSFIGGIGFARTRGLDMFRACTFAARCSAITIGRLGAQPSMPTYDEVCASYGPVETA